MSLVVPVLDRHAVDQHPVEGAVASFEGRALGVGQPAEGVVQRVGGQVGVETGESVPQPALQDDLPVVGALSPRRVRRDVEPVRHAPADAGQPVEGSLLDVSFGEGVHGPDSHGPRGSPSTRKWPPNTFTSTVDNMNRAGSFDSRDTSTR